jgi:hypothetical protein
MVVFYGMKSSLRIGHLFLLLEINMLWALVFMVSIGRWSTGPEYVELYPTRAACVQALKSSNKCVPIAASYPASSPEGKK